VAVDRAAWDRRYDATDLVWSDRPNRFLVDETVGLAPGRALDVACGEGRNAVWLAGRGWAVTGADFSPVAIGKARRLATAHGVEATFVEADARTWQPPGRYDLVALCYLQMPPDMLGGVLERLVPAVAAGGTLLVIGHDRRNLAEGVGGPRDPEVLLDPRDVAGLVRPHLAVERAETVERPVPEADRPALDTLVRARRTGDAR
jgi:SAM-dependent methyltransferase